MRILVISLLLAGCSMNPHTWKECDEMRRGTYDYQDKSIEYIIDAVEFCRWDEHKAHMDALKDIEKAFPHN